MKNELLILLDDSEVRKKILNIVDSRKIYVTSESINNESDAENYRRRIRQLENDVDNLTVAKNSAVQKYSTAERQLETLRAEVFRLKNNLSQIEKSNQNLQFEVDRLKNANLKLERENSDFQEQLSQRFSRGWELFQKYNRVGSHARQILRTGVFTRDNDFMSFICGGAQTNSLEILWDVLKECVMNEQRQDAEILLAIFEYCIELVNSSKAQASYSILPVKIGDRFDSDFHSEGPHSRAQGNIVAVYLPGYKNNYNGKIIRKSIVRVN